MTIRINNGLTVLGLIGLGLAAFGYIAYNQKQTAEADEARKEMTEESDDIKQVTEIIAKRSGLKPEERATAYLRAKELHRAIQNAATRKDVEKAIDNYRDFLKMFDTWEDDAIRAVLIALKTEEGKRNDAIEREDKAKNIKEIADAVRSIGKQVSPYVSPYISLDVSNRRWS